MFFKEILKMKLPFTRKGLEDYLDEQTALMQRQQTDNLHKMEETLTVRFAEEVNTQLDRRINDLQDAVIGRLTQEMNAQLHRRMNDLDQAITFQTEVLTDRFAAEMNTQLDRRMNDLQDAVIGQLTQEMNAQLHRRMNDLDQAITFQTEVLTDRFAAEMNTQLDRRMNDLQDAVIGQLTQEMNAQLHSRINDLDQAITFQTEVLTDRFAAEMNTQLDRRMNDLQDAVIGQLTQEMNAQLHRRINDLQGDIRIQNGNLAAELGRLLRNQQAEGAELGLKDGRQVFLFACAPENNKAVNLSKTFYGMGYEVYYLFDAQGMKAINDEPVSACFAEYVSLDACSHNKLTDMLRKGAIFVFLSDSSIFSPYLSIARKYGFCVVCLQDEENFPSSEAAEEAWYIYCDTMLQRVNAARPAVPRISIVVLNYNNGKIIFRCIDSLLKFREHYNYEIIVVDNASTDGSPEALEEYYKEKIVLLRNSKNGCASGRNMGVSSANGEFIYFLDSDQWIVSPRFLDNALDIMARISQIGAVGWAAGWFTPQNVLGPISDDFPNRGIGFPNVLYRTDIAYLGTGGMLVRKAIFDEVDGFDEAYDPTCFEDTDFSLKIKYAGYKLAYCPYMGVFHQPHQTTLSGSNSHKGPLERNRDYFKRKWEKLDPSLLEVYK